MPHEQSPHDKGFIQVPQTWLRQMLAHRLNRSAQTLHHLQERRESAPVRPLLRLGETALDTTFTIIEKPIAYSLLYNTCHQLVQEDSGEAEHQYVAVDTEQFDKIHLYRATHTEYDGFQIVWSDHQVEQTFKQTPKLLRAVEYDQHNVLLGQNLKGMEYVQKCSYIQDTESMADDPEIAVASTQQLPLTTQRAVQLAVSLRG